VIMVIVRGWDISKSPSCRFVRLELFIASTKFEHHGAKSN
jgi:hypothetical protein